ncbi:MAG TPA: TIGR02391 family protein [Candidatus Saccharimonadia bacterium]|nr:TIGR02391 family protein [Candidatus Saccharimonadia bacterium]
MNKEWARERLQKYLEAVRAYVSNIEDGEGYNQQAYEDVMALEPAAKAIMKQANPDFKDYNFIHHAHNTAITSVIHSLALLRDAEEMEANLKPAGPQLGADTFHPWVWESARSLWATRHYREAVQASATSINAHLQDLSGRRDVSDYKLVIELFSELPPSKGKPRLRWPGEPSDEEYKSMQGGIRSFGSGIFQTIRNTSSHNLIELTEQEALERLAAMSLLCSWVEKCELVHA